jgi:hypothetical protein
MPLKSNKKGAIYMDRMPKVRRTPTDLWENQLVPKLSAIKHGEQVLGNVSGSLVLKLRGSKSFNKLGGS